MLRWAFLIALTLGARASAADIVVEAGEHADFSRLVLQLPQADDWSFGKVEDGYELRLKTVGNQFDLTRVFQKIPKSRIAAVTSPDGFSVRLKVACDCHADAFEIRNGRIVLDIKDGPPKAESVFEQPLTNAPAEPEAEDSIDEPPMISETALDNRTLPVEPQPEDLAQTMPEPAIVPVAEKLDSKEVDDSRPISLDTQVLPLFGFGSFPLNPLEAGTDARLDMMENALIHQLGRASSQGLILLAPGSEAPEPLPKPETGPDQKTTRRADIPPESENPPSQHVRIETALDRAAPRQGLDQEMTFEGRECLPDAYFDVAAWGPEDTRSGLSLAIDRSVLGEFDAPLDAEIEAAVRHYIHLGFGFEAKGLLSAFTAKIDRADILWQLADIVDDPGSGRAIALQTQISCSSMAALWAVLSVPGLQPGDPVEAAAVLQNFSGLPIHLRQHLGPALAERFLEAGDAATATSIRNMITRNPAVPEAGTSLLQARIDAELGKAEASLQQLQKVVSEGGPDAAEALVELIDAKFDAGQEIDPLTSQLAEAFAYENQGTDIGRRLTLTAIRGMIASLRLEVAFEAIKDATGNGGLTPAESVELLNKAHLTSAENSNNVDFLRFLRLFGDPTDIPEMRSARHAVAARLLELRFSDHVRTLLISEERPPDNEDRVKLAQAALIERKAAVALSYLVGLPDPEIVGLRAQALEMANQSADAADLYQADGLIVDAARAAWVSGDWDIVAALGTDRQKSAADLFATLGRPGQTQDDAGPETMPRDGVKAEVTPDPAPTLQSGRALLERSQSTRDAILGLLDAER